MKERADVVVIGAGIVGCSAAHYLTQAGVRNVVVIDQGPIGDTGGSSFHAPGLCFQTNGSKLSCTLAQWTRALYRELDTPERRTWWEVGSLEVATTPERLAELRRRHAYATSWGLESHVIGPDEALRHNPLLDRELGARRPLRAERRHRQGRQHLPGAAGARRGARRRRSSATRARLGIDMAGGRVRAVETDQGTIVDLDRARLPRPVGAGVHALARPARSWRCSRCSTSSPGPSRCPSWPGRRVEIEQPILRHQDRAMYFRQRGEGYGIGAYGHDPITIEPHELERHPGRPPDRDRARSREEHWPESLAWAHELLPPLAGVGIAETFNGHFSFAVDNNSFAGPSSQVGGLWLADGIWVTHGGGTAKAVVDLMTTGRCELDLGPMHPDRLHRLPAQPALRQGARAHAVRRGLRHHPPRPGAGAPARRAHDSLARALPRPRRRAHRERRLGARAVVPRQRRAAAARRHARALGLGAAALVAHDRPRAPRDAHAASASST